MSDPPAATGLPLPRPSVIFSEILPTGIRARLDILATRTADPRTAAIRHTTCFCFEASKNHSQSLAESVNSGNRTAKMVMGNRGLSFRRGSVDRACSGRCCCWNHGAARNGYRKRTRVRVACGVTIRPCGVGILSSHGHIGRSVGGWFGSFVVLQPHSEALLRREHLSSGPGLPTAALTGSYVGFVRMSAPADSIERATRHLSAVVNRAASVPAQPVGMSGGWTRRTRPDPRMRLRTV